MVGSRDSVAAPNVILNTIVAEAFAEACDYLEEAEDFDRGVHDLIKKYAYEHQRIVFSEMGTQMSGLRKQSGEGFRI